MRYEIYRQNGKALSINDTESKIWISIDPLNRHYQEFLKWNDAQAPENKLDLSDKEPEPVIETKEPEVEAALSLVKQSKLSEDDLQTLVKLLVEKLLK